MLIRPLLLQVLLTALVLGGTSLAKEPVKRGEPVLSNEALQQFIQELDDRFFAVREKAQRQLADAGVSAIAAVGEAAEKGTLERSTRAVNILLEWSGSDDDKLRFAALERLSKLGNRPAEAELAQKILERFREQVALKTLVEAGAKIRRDPRIVLNTSIFSLQVVFDPETKTDAEVLAAVAEVKAVSVVSFYSTRVTAEALKSLETAKQVQRIEFYGTAIAPASLARLKEKLPNVLHIEVRNSAQLGIRGDIDRNDGYISSVLPGSAADRAGLRSHDTVTHVDGVEVKGFVHLTSLIAKHQAGDKATLTVKRPNVSKAFELDVTFGRWGEKEEGKPLTLQELRQRTPEDFHISNHRR